MKSMTGYGKGEASLSTGKLTIEIRSLNGKNCDINIKSSLIPKDRDIEVRKCIADSASRGTVDVLLNFEPKVSDAVRKINAEAMKAYACEIREAALAGGISVDDPTLLSEVLHMPDVFDSRKQDIIPEEEWPLVRTALDEALSALDTYRTKEGKALYADVTSRVAKIQELEDKVESLEQERLATVRERILKNAEDLKIKMEGERFEQEMIFYLEKLDINEEKVRLRQHCRYFLDTINSEEEPGRKLGFIIQEMGREINTTGSKANHAGIQKLVVQMKDELEKIREQSMNIL